MNGDIVSAVVAGVVAIAGLIFRARTVKKRKRNKVKEVSTTSFINNKKKEVNNA